MGRAKNCANPVCHEDVSGIGQAIAAGAIAQPFLSLLQLFKKAEIARHWG